MLARLVKSGCTCAARIKPPKADLTRKALFIFAAPSPQMAANVLQDQVAKKVVLTRTALLDAVDNIRGAVMMAFPQGLPEWDFVRQAIEGQEDLSGTSVSATRIVGFSHQSQVLLLVHGWGFCLAPHNAS